MAKESNLEHVCVTIVHPAFCVFLYLTGVHFQGKLQHGGDASQQKISANQSELRKYVVPHCQTYYMLS